MCNRVQATNAGKRSREDADDEIDSDTDSDMDPEKPLSEQIYVHLSKMQKDVCHIPVVVDGKQYNVLVVHIKTFTCVAPKVFKLSGQYYKPSVCGLLTKKSNFERVDLSDRDLLVRIKPDSNDTKCIRLSQKQIRSIEDAVRESQITE